ncbi:MAG: LuxR C-terminal-related transcriptional regulator [Thermomicrobiales bacterium]
MSNRHISVWAISMEPNSETDAPLFGDVLRRLRMERGVSQARLSEVSGVSVRGISDLERGLRRSPRTETVRLLAQALELSADEWAELLLSSRKAGQVRKNARSELQRWSLPFPVDEFVGRALEIGRVTGMLQSPGTRLVTLTGPGGVGKTRLALEIARNLPASVAHRIVIVPLGQIHDFRGVLPAVARALGIDSGEETVQRERLTAALGRDRVLLILDNFEHVLQAAPLVTKLLESCSQLKIVVTSRTALSTAGEHRIPLGPMPSPPDIDNMPKLDDMMSFDAVRLFVVRARAINPTFEMTEANASVVAGICRHLEGIPLAIELAAARSSFLDPDALLTTLHPRLPRLTAGGRDRPERLQTMRNAISWSYDLLIPEQQALFRRLGVFEGGIYPGIASEVAELPWRKDVLDAIGRLVEQSLVQSMPADAGVPRFLMLETIREYALERLQLDPECKATRDRHAAAFLALAEELRPQFEGPAGGEALHRLEVEHRNLLAALSLFIERGDTDRALRMGGALWKFWFVHGHLRLGLERLVDALNLTGGDFSNDRAEVLYGAGSLARELGYLTRSARYAEELSTLSADRSDVVHQAMARFLRGTLAAGEKNLGAAADHFDAALKLFREEGHDHGYAMMLHQSANAARELGDVALAESRHREALAIWRNREDQWGTALALNGLALDAELGLDDHRAADFFIAAMDINAQYMAPVNLLSGIEGIARLAARNAQARLAVQLFSAAEASHRNIGSTRDHLTRSRNDAALQLARSVLDEMAFASAWDSGQEMSIETARVVAETEYNRGAKRLISRPNGAHLSKREIEVLRLVASGHTDREIGAVLFISRRTVTTHVTSILNKFGVDSRTAATAIAVRSGLV